MQLPGIPPDLLSTVQDAARDCGVTRLALVGGAVRDGLRHHEHGAPWSGLPDLDFVLEGSAALLAETLQTRCGTQRVSELRVHAAYGTAELVLDGVLLDLASARQERYPAPGLNPVVQPGDLEMDLARRDFTVNALAFELSLQDPEVSPLQPPSVIDLHGGQQHLAHHQLAFLHDGSVADDPTRVIRAARYGARLGFSLAPEASRQIDSVLKVWPWGWRIGEPPEKAPPALATRMRMELELLFAREPWPLALRLLQSCGGLTLLDPALQADSRLLRRLGHAQRLGLPLLTALVANAPDPAVLGARLQLPLVQQRQLLQFSELLQWLKTPLYPDMASWSAAEWSEALEQRAIAPEAVAHAVCLLINDSAAGVLWKPLLRWWGRWRHVQAPVTARELMDQGWSSGPELGAELRRLRRHRLTQMR